MNKSELRKYYFKKRDELSLPKLEELNEKIAQGFGTISFTDIRLVHIFYPIAGKKEVDSLSIKAFLLKDHPLLQFVLPKSNLAENTLTHILWQEDTPLAVNSWGITEPLSGEEVLPQDIDMVTVPLLVFDKQGNRLGYGKGFYDRFLVQCRPDTLKVGVSFFEPEEYITGIDKNDVPLDMCITPKKVWYF